MLKFIKTSFENSDFPYFFYFSLNPVTKYVTNQCLFKHWLKHKRGSRAEKRHLSPSLFKVETHRAH